MPGDAFFNFGTLNLDENNFGVSEIVVTSSIFLFEMLLPCSTRNKNMIQSAYRTQKHTKINKYLLIF